MDSNVIRASWIYTAGTLANLYSLAQARLSHPPNTHTALEKLPVGSLPGHVLPSLSQLFLWATTLLVPTSASRKSGRHLLLPSVPSRHRHDPLLDRVPPPRAAASLSMSPALGAPRALRCPTFGPFL